MSLILKYGLFSGIGLCAWMLLEYALGIHSTHIAWSQYSDLLSMIIPVFAITLGMMAWRDSRGDGNITLGKGVSVGMGIGLISSLIATLFFFVYTRWINPAYFDHYTDWQASLLTAAGKSAQDVAHTKELFYEAARRGYFILAKLTLLLACSFILSIFIAVWVKRGFRPRAPRV